MAFCAICLPSSRGLLTPLRAALQFSQGIVGLHLTLCSQPLGPDRIVTPNDSWSDTVDSSATLTSSELAPLGTRSNNSITFWSGLAKVSRLSC